MSAAVLGDSALLVLALSALAGGALALASTLAEDGLPRLLAAITFTAAAAVLESLVLGCFGLGGNPLALSGLAVVTGLVLWRACPAPARPPGRELAAALSGAGTGGLIALGAVTGALLAVAAIELHRPMLGQDAVTYHLPEVIDFVQSGHPGRVFNDFYGLPVGNYPVTEEVLLAWVTAVSHGFSALILLTLATVPLLLAAGWSGLRALGVGPVISALTLAAFALVPLVLQAWTQPGTDLQAFAWLACTAALCLAARENPRLLAAAVVSGGLAIGTKTTVVTWVLVILALTAWLQRAELRARWRALLGAAVLAVLTGLIWYLRNWVDHGSPLWPFSSFPGGDPRPKLIDYLSTSLLQSLQRTLLDHLNAYAAALSGGVVLALGGIAAALPGALLRRRWLVVAGAVVLAGALEYAAGPVTGLPAHGGLELVGVVGSTLRYLMPVWGAGAVALALTAADSNRLLAGAGASALAGTVVWDVVSAAGSGFYLAYDGWLWPGIALGAVALPALAWALRRIRSISRSAAALGAAGVGAVATLVLAVGATHFDYRNAVTKDFAAPITAFLLTQPLYVDTDLPMATSGTGLAALAGDRLEHRLTVIPQHASCSQVAGYVNRDWVVAEVTQPDTRSGVLSHVVQTGTAEGCLARLKPAYDDGQYAVYAPVQPTLASLLRQIRKLRRSGVVITSGEIAAAGGS